MFFCNGLAGDYTMVCIQNCNLKTRDEKPIQVQADAPKA